ncbi:hypothetical protein B0H11DRAFT_1205369 [Mycena galericulata]|nr:hypothetical protein B0H11DRAFT_1205369 [Mycena galericulata]
MVLLSGRRATFHPAILSWPPVWGQSEDAPSTALSLPVVPWPLVWGPSGGAPCDHRAPFTFAPSSAGPARYTVGIGGDQRKAATDLRTVDEIASGVQMDYHNYTYDCHWADCDQVIDGTPTLLKSHLRTVHSILLSKGTNTVCQWGDCQESVQTMTLPRRNIWAVTDYAVRSAKNTPTPSPN